MVYTIKIYNLFVGENELSEQVFNLNWAVISLGNATYKVNETEKYLEITLLRRGYLGETSFVSKLLSRRELYNISKYIVKLRFF